jgi:DNA-binding PadR family transcriptional regulator
MSPVFRHGRLRLYLLKLLDESPRHGYEVIRLLQDRFLGVYAPSPGTIYPRLARLEEDGLVTHEEVDGKKVYSITDKGRDEIRSRLSDLADLEDELTESLRDVAREISEDVRETVRGIREELSAAAREFRSQHADRPEGPTTTPSGESASTAATSEKGTDDASRIREEARQAREEMRARFRSRNRGHGDWAAWQERIGRPDWAGWAPWSERAGGQRPGPGAANPFTDLERLAIQFANELRTVARQAGNIGERSLSDLRDILTDTLAKVRLEVFADDAADTADGSGSEQPSGPPGQGPANSS